MNNTRLHNLLLHYQHTFHPVLAFDPDTDKLLPLDFTAANTQLNEDIITYTKHFTWHINQKLEGYKYGIGGYNEDRILYKRSKHFDGKEPRTIHLGIDIWAAAGTKVYAPLGGVVHSTAFNNNFGDYGATIILQHQIDGIAFHTLYGHVSVKDLAPLPPGKFISRGELVAHFGEPSENGDWPPHLHFQIIEDMECKEGDYPGVCSVSERERYLTNCPDPNLILNML
ncbi:MAG: peptidoglycan DD-metalloendopeptidase family protein [Bacteroidota bacterium]